MPSSTRPRPILRSTISGNVSNDVGGGIRSLGTMTSPTARSAATRATGWHGGAIFQTDANLAISSSTIANNIGPDWAPSTIFIGQFGGSVRADADADQHDRHRQPLVRLRAIRLGHDCHCRIAATTWCRTPAATRRRATRSLWDALIGPLADNGGPTWTHALQPASPAIDAADDAACPATDQRGVARPQGADCDVGAFER